MKEKAKKLLKKNHNLKNQVLISIIFSVGFFLVALGISHYLFLPRIEINNQELLIIKVNTDYQEYGAKVSSIIKSSKSKIKIVGSVDSKKVGTYQVYYKVNGLFGENTRVREVKVIDDIKPEITLEGEVSFSLCPNAKYVEAGYLAVDNYDGDLTAEVKITEKDNDVIYYVQDSSGNSNMAARNIKREDLVKPKISLKGYSHYYLKLNNKYYEEGYTASDNCSDVSNKVTVSGTVNTSQVGTYNLTYTVQDEFNNQSSIERKVTVYNPANPNFNTVYKPGHIYLTFDDGPGNITSKVLDILKDEGIKATFFVINKGTAYDYLIRRAYDEGHTIALHSGTHDYKKIYSSISAYFDDLNNISNVVKRVTGTESKIIRFPGGSSNTVSIAYYPGIMTVLTNEVLSRGYHYFDWNVDSEDAGSAETKEHVYYNVINGLRHNQTNIVLMHDCSNNYKTLNALRDIINFGKANGYTFAPIDMETPMIRHRLNN